MQIELIMSLIDLIRNVYYAAYNVNVNSLILYDSSLVYCFQKHTTLLLRH